MEPQKQEHNYVVGKEYEEGLNDPSTTGNILKTRHIVIVVCTKCGDTRKNIIL